MTELGLDKPVQDVEAAIEELKRRGAKKVAVTGYCWGGTIAWLSATRLKPDAVSAYYGGGIHGTKNEKPKVPTQMHFGDKDMHIPMTHVNELRKLHPNVQIFDYPADHGFHCDERGSYDAAASKQADGRARWSSSASTLARRPSKKTFTPEARGPLNGVRVVDLSRLVAGNILTLQLADFGAEVIKIEPPEGDTLRSWRVKGIETAWKVYSRNKKSVALDLRSDAGRAIVRELAKIGADPGRELPAGRAGGHGPRRRPSCTRSIPSSSSCASRAGARTAATATSRASAP